MRGPGSWLACLWLLAALTPPAAAQNQGLVVHDDTFGPGGAVGPGLDPLGQPADYLITPDLGETAGGNLFHSFSQFGIGTGETATFTGPDPVDGPQSVDHVIGRVTGPGASAIDGTLRATIPGADVYLLNPAGVMFGADAALDVQGSFHASTADSLRLGDAEFPVDRAAPLDLGALAVAPPSAFGFLGGGGGPIDVIDSQLAVPSGQTLSLSGGDVEIQGASLSAPSGRVQLAAVDGAGEIALLDAGGAPTWDTESFGSQGPLRLTNHQGRPTVVDVSGPGAGSVFLRGGEIRIDGGNDATLGSSVVATTEGDLDGGVIDVRARERLAITDNALLVSTTEASGSGADLVVVAPEIVLERIGGIQVFGGEDSTGRVGGIRVEAPVALSLSGRDGTIFSGARGAGSAGPIVVDAGTVTISQYNSRIEAENRHGGSGADIHIDADAISLHDGAFIRTLANGGSGDGGSITIQTGSLEVVGNGGLRERSEVLALTRGGAIGDVVIRADDLVIRDGGRIATASVDDATADAGDILLTVERLEISSHGEVTSFTGTRLGAGDIRVGTDALSNTTLLIAGTELEGPLEGFEPVPTGISSRSQVEGGDSGGVTIALDEITLRDGALITTVNLVQGETGDVHLVVDELSVESGSAVDSSTVLFADGGDILVEAGESVRVVGTDRSGQSSRIGSLAVTYGSAGDVEIRSPLLIVDGGTINTTTAGFGNFEFTVPNPAGPGELMLGLEPIIMFLYTGDRMSIWADENFEDGEAGSISVTADRIQVLGGGQVDSSSFSTGAAGDIRLEAVESLSVSGQGSEVVSRPGLGGSGGTIVVDTPLLSITDGARVSVEAGDETLDANRLLGGGLSTIFTAFIAESDNDLVESIFVASGLVPLRGDVVNELLEADPDEAGAAGSLEIRSGQLVIGEGSISAGAIDSSGGNVTIEADSITGLEAGEITTSVFGGTGGNIDIESPLLVLLGSKIVAEADAGFGGAIRISSSAVLADPASSISAAAGQNPEFSGTVEIDAPDVDIAGQLAALPEAALDASRLLRPACAARGSEAVGGRFVVEGRQGAPPAPDGWLPAPVVLASSR